MAVNVEGNAIVKVDGQQAGQEIEKLEQKTKDLRAELRRIKKEKPYEGQEAEVKKLNTQIKHTGQEVRALKKGSIDYKKTLNNLSGMNLNNLTKVHRSLNFEIKQLGSNTVQFAQKSKQLKQVGAEIKRIKTQITALNTQTSMMGKMADGFNKYMGFLAGISAAFVGVTLGVRSFITSFNDFEERIDNLQALTGLAGDNLQYLEDKALSLSTSTTKEGINITQSAKDIADGFTLIGSKRSELLESKEALAAVTKDAIILAQAAKTDLDPAAKGLAITMNQFNAEASDSRRIINAIAAGSKAGAADIPYLSKAIEKMGTTANIMKISVEESIGVIETIAPYYAEASMAGNSLDKVFMKLKAQQIGYKDGVFDLNTAIEELSARFANGETSSKLFGVEHAKMGELLVQNKDKLKYFTDAVTGTNVAIEQATINTDNNNAKLAQAKNRAEAEAIALGEKLAPALTISTNGVRYLLKALTILVDNFDSVKKILAITVSTIATYTLVTKGAAIATKAQAIATNILTVAQKAFNTASKANPFGLILAAVVAVTAGIVAYRDELNLNSKAIKEFNKDLVKERTELDNVFTALNNSTKGSDNRRKLLDEINTTYKEYLPNLLTETSSLEDIAAAQEIVNQKLTTNLAIKSQKAAIDEAIAESIEARAESTGDIIAWATKENAHLAAQATDDLNTLIEKASQAKTATSGMMDGFSFSKEMNAEMDAFYDKYLKDNEGFMHKGAITFKKNIENILLAEKDKNDKLIKIKAGFSSYITTTQTDESVQELARLKRQFSLGKISQEEYNDARLKLNKNYNQEFFKLRRQLSAGSITNEEFETYKLKLQEKYAFELDVATETAEKIETITNYGGGGNKLQAELDAKMQALDDFTKFIKNKQLELADIDDYERKKAELNAYYDEAIAKVEDYEEAKDEIEQLNQLRDEELNQLKIDNTEKTEQALFDIKKRYGLLTKEELIADEIATFENTEQYKTLTVQQQETARDNIRKKYYKKEDKRLTDQQQKLQDQAKLSVKLIDQFTNIVSAAVEGNDETIASSMKAFIAFSLDMLKNQVQMAIAGATIQSLTQPDSIATFGVSGLARATILVGLIEAAFAVVKGKVNSSFSVGGYTGPGASNDVAGIVHKNEYVIPSKMLADSRIMQVVHSLESVRTGGSLDYSGLNRAISSGFEQGGFTSTPSPSAPGTNKLDDKFFIILSEIKDFRAALAEWQADLKTYVVFDDIQEKADEINTIKTNVTL